MSQMNRCAPKSPFALNAFNTLNPSATPCKKSDNFWYIVACLSLFLEHQEKH